VAGYDDIIDAIGVIQERLGMAGASQEEAAHTIQGSIASAKAAWTNLLAGFADPDADLGKLTDNVMQSLDGLADNAIPAVERVLTSMGDALTKAAPQLRDKLTRLVTSLTPSLSKAAVSLFGVLARTAADTLPSIADALLTSLEQLFDEGGDIAASLVDGALAMVRVLASHAPEFIRCVFSLIRDVATKALDQIEQDPAGFVRQVGDILSAIFDGAGSVITAVAPRLGELVRNMLDLVFTPENMQSAGEFGRGIVTTLVGGVDESTGENTPGLIGIIGSWFAEVLKPENIASVVGFANSTVQQIASSFDSADMTTLNDTVSTIFGGLLDVVDGFDFESITNFAVSALTGLGNGLAQAIDVIAPYVSQIISDIATSLSSEENVNKMTETFKNLIGSALGLLKTLADSGAIANVVNAAVSIVESIIRAITDPENLQKLLDTGVALVREIGLGLGKIAERAGELLPDVVGSIVSFITNPENLGKMIDAGLKLIGNLAIGLWNGLTAALGGIGNNIMGWIADITGDKQLAEEVRTNREYMSKGNNPFKIAYLDDHTDTPTTSGGGWSGGNSSAANSVLNSSGEQFGGTWTLNNTVELDGEVVAENVWERERAEYAAYGY